MINETTEFKNLELKIMERHLQGVVSRTSSGSRYGEAAKRQLDNISQLLKKKLGGIKSGYTRRKTR